MQSSTLETTTPTNVQVKVKERFIFVLLLHSGKWVVGSATNPCRRITALNSGMNRAIPKTLQVNRIIGIKPMNADRTVVSVFKMFEDKYGEGNVIAV